MTDRATKEGGITTTPASGSGEARDTLSRERVLLAAMDLADERGLEALTMRELGRRLGVEAASLYNHVRGKADLLDGLVELVVAEIDVPSRADGWKEALRRRAVSAREVFSRHPWAAALIDSRETNGPGSLSYADRVLGTLLAAGFPPRTAAHAFFVLDSYIYGFERQRSYFALGEDVDAAEAARGVLAAIPQGAYPALSQVAAEFAAEPFDDDDAFAFGLGLILDGLQRLL